MNVLIIFLNVFIYPVNKLLVMAITFALVVCKFIRNVHRLCKASVVD